MQSDKLFDITLLTRSLNSRCVGFTYTPDKVYCVDTRFFAHNLAIIPAKSNQVR